MCTPIKVDPATTACPSDEESRHDEASAPRVCVGAEPDDKRHRFWCTGCGARPLIVVAFGPEVSRGKVRTAKVRLCPDCIDAGAEALMKHRIG